MSFLCSENKDADQLRIYHAADLCLCFSICKKAGLNDVAQLVNMHLYFLLALVKTLTAFFHIK